MTRSDPEARFWAKVTKTETCWLWTGASYQDGYGAFRPSSYKTIGAHRFAYMLAHGDLPPGLEVCHSCDEPACVRPSHLFLGSHSQNMIDAALKGRMGRVPRHKSPLTVAAVQRIRELASSMTQMEIAAQFGIDQTYVSDIIHRKSWRDVG